MSGEESLRADLARMRSEMIALLAVNQTLRVSRDLSALYHVVATQVANVVPCDSLFIAVYLPETDRLHYVYSVDEGIVDTEDVVRSLGDSPLSARIVRTRQVVRIDDLDEDPIRKQGGMLAFGQTDKRSRAWLGVPMISGDVVQGVLSVQSYQPAAFGAADADILLLLASQVSVALENARLIDHLQRTIAELSTPLIPVAEGVLVLPLVGTIDGDRAGRVLEQALDAIVARQADHLLIDVTGVVAVDEFVVAQLTKIVRAAGLLGARSSLVGMSAAMARTAAALDFDLRAIETYRDLRSALADIL
jgi:anti-anti-sigma regulatory factor/putative methionine-R-sulfoxide reductase with GAF domain